MKRGEPAGRRRIEEVRKEAESRGLGLLARQADEALAPSVQRPPASQRPIPSSVSSARAASPWSVSSIQSR
jgi:hypothetical protein